jgi:hypothetical protein
MLNSIVFFRTIIALVVSFAGIAIPGKALSQATAPSDTARMQAGWRDWSRYTTSMCHAAVVEMLEQQRHVIDSSRYTSWQGQPMPTSIAVAARDCYSVAKPDWVPQGGTDEEATFRINLRRAIDLGDDAEVQALIDRRIAELPTPAQQADVLVNAISLFLSKSRGAMYRAGAGPRGEQSMGLSGGFARPVRVALAEAALARLDSMASDTAVAWRSFIAMRHMLNYHYIPMGDTNVIRRMAEETLRREKMLPDRQRIELTTGVKGTSTYQVLLGLTVGKSIDPTQDPEVREFVKRVQEDQPQIAEGVNILLMSTFEILGKRFKPPTTKFWYRANPVYTEISKSTKPPLIDTTIATPWQPGRLTLVVQLRHYCLLTSAVRHGGQGMDYAASYCHQTYATIRRMMQEFGPQGVDLVIFDRTAGYAFRSGPLTPEEEAPRIWMAYHTDIALPVTMLGVEVTPFSRRDPGLDDRRRDDWTDLQEEYRIGASGNWGVRPEWFVIDTSGTILGFGQFTSNTEEWLQINLRKLIDSNRRKTLKPVPTSSTPNP